MGCNANQERRALWVMRLAGTAVLLLSAVMMAVLPASPVSENVPGFLTPVVGFELASSPNQVSGILGRAGTPERAATARRMDLGARIDFLFAVAYPVLYVGIALLLTAHGHLAATPRVVLYALLASVTVADWLENRELLVLCWASESHDIGAVLERLRIATLVKWYALYAASAILAVFIRGEVGWWRWSAAFFAAAALIGFSSVFHLPAIEYSLLALIPAWIMAYVRAWWQAAGASQASATR
jgi:hypothetical protein